MQRELLNTAPWRLLILTAATAPLTVWAGARWGETGGAVTLAALIVPVACSALSGRLAWGLVAALVAAAGIYAEAGCAGGPDGGSGLRFASVGATSIVAMAVIVATTVRLLKQQLSRHREELRDSSDEWLPLGPVVVGKPGSEVQNAVQTDHSSIAADGGDIPLALMTLQDIGRRISMNLDLETLVPAIVSTATSSLDCTLCEVFLWDRSREKLANPLRHPATGASAYIPSTRSGVGAWVLRERTVFQRSDAGALAALSPPEVDAQRLPEAVAPLVVGNDVLGVIVIDGVRSTSPNWAQMLHTLAGIYAMGLKNAQLFRRVEEMALRDGLTGLFNHATIQRRLRGLLREALIEETRFALIMSDADHFKRINDTYGHQAGDEVLRELARLWKAALPDSAILARYGGEEFIAALPGYDLQQAAELAEFLCESIAEHPFSFEGRALRVTASFGIAEYRGPEQTVDDLVREADENLYAAKDTGRNRVVSRPRQARFFTAPTRVRRA